MTPTDAPTSPANATQLGHWRAVFGESALWSTAENATWWLDMHGHAILLTSPDGTTKLWKTPGPHLPWARALTLRESGGLIVALGDTLAAFDPLTGNFLPLPLDLTLPPGHLFNDATTDSAGALIIGTMLPGRGNDGRALLYRIAPDLKVTILAEKLNTTNGLAFSPDGATLYYSDSHADVRKIWAAPYTPSTGQARAPRLFADFAHLPGKPDGATIDTQGHYWSAAMASPWLHRFTPAGRLELSLELPLDTPTRPTFAGPDLTTLHLTTAGPRSGETDDNLKGALLAIPAPAVGLAAWPARL